MVNHESSPSRVRKKREEENVAIGTPSKKSKRGGKDVASEAACPDVSEKISPKKGEDGNNAITAEGNEDENPQGTAEEIVNDGNTHSVDPSAAPAATPEAASPPEPPAQEVYRIPSYAGVFIYFAMTFRCFRTGGFLYLLAVMV